MPKITIYTDGAAKGNPGNGGYGVVMMSGKHKKNSQKALETLPTTEWNYLV